MFSSICRSCIQPFALGHGPRSGGRSNALRHGIGPIRRSSPQAAIAIKNIATGITRTSSTSTAGFYSVPNLLPGSYEIRASAQGFSTELQTGITLTVGEQQVLNFTLQVGQIAQTVEVSTEAPTVELGSSSISAVINSTTVRELPLNGRSWTDLAALQ